MQKDPAPRCQSVVLLAYCERATDGVDALEHSLHHLAVGRRPPPFIGHDRSMGRPFWNGIHQFILTMDLLRWISGGNSGRRPSGDRNVTIGDGAIVITTLEAKKGRIIRECVDNRRRSIKTSLRNEVRVVHIGSISVIGAKRRERENILLDVVKQANARTAIIG